MATIIYVVVSSQAVANEFLRLAKSETKELTNMQVQKLVFLAQGYSLALLGEPAYYHKTHAWQWGPVVPKLYKSLQKYGSGYVSNVIRADDAIAIDSRESKIVRGVWEAYKNYTGSQLSALTHRQGTPWSQTWERERFGIIPIDLIREYYSRLVPTA